MARTPGKLQGVRSLSGACGTQLCPLLPVAAGLALAVVCFASPLVCSGWGWSCLAVLAGLLLVFLWDAESRCLLAAGLLLGAGLTLLHVRAPWQTYRRMVDSAATGTLTAQVIDPFADPGPFGHGPDRRRVIVQVRSLHLAGAAEAVSCRGKALLILPIGINPDYGDLVQVEGTIHRCFAPYSEQRFDYRRYLLSRGIRHQILATGCRIVRQAAEKPALSGLLYRLRRRLSERLVDGIGNEDNARAIAAMTFGYRDALHPGMERAFTRSGAIHIFAISGLHVGIAMGVLVLLLKWVAVPFVWRFRLLPVLLGGYVFLTGCPASAVRAWVMLSVLSLSLAVLRVHSPINGLSLAAIILLSFNPLSLFNAGFQFSFVIVSALVLGWPGVTRIVDTCFEKSAWQTGVSPLARKGGDLLRKLLAVIGCGLVAWLGSAGLVAWNNCLFIPAAIWVNVCIAGLAFAVLAMAVGKLILVSLGLGMIALPLNRALDGLLSLVHGLVQTASGAGSFGIPRPPHMVIVLYYLLFFLVLHPHLAHRHRKILFAFLVGNMILMFGGSLFLQGAADRVTIFYGDGQQQVAGMIETGGRVPVLFVSGNYVVDRAALETLKLRGYDRIQMVLLPGNTKYAAKGLAAILLELEVERLFLPEKFQFVAENPELLPSAAFVRRMELASSGNPAGALRLPSCLKIRHFSGRSLQFSFSRPLRESIEVSMEADRHGGARLCLQTAAGVLLDERLPATREVRRRAVKLRH